ncbi:hypothetical protein AB0I16_05770 [Streptomyces sp. NPDC050703]|uniref:hypothetical protein n=1 Tax=Streptomyces sp. NPDC050703 TaxID=3157218 RepID=UPI00344A3227
MAVTGREAVADAARLPRGRRDRLLLLAACGFPVLLSLALVPLTLPLGWDELVYASRFSPYGPATDFSAPRTRGVPLLIAPVASWSDSVVLLRAWLLALSGAALYAAFLPWLRVLRRGSAVAVAAALYGGLWITSFYASGAMPNHYTAMGGVGAVGLFLWQRQSPLTRAGIAGWLALATLMRPNDGFALGLPLLLAALLVPAWRGPGRVVAVLCGLAAGALPWAVEAYVRFGGVLQRLAEASEIQGDLRPLPAVAHHLTVLDGPLLCRPCTGDDLRLAAAEWWVLLPLLVGAGLWSLRGREADPGGRGARPRGRGAGPAVLSVVTALAVALPYLLLVPYAAPRFLLPAHALLAPTAALGLLALVDGVRAARLRRVLALGLGIALAGHLAVQAALVRGNARIQAGARGDWQRVTEVLHRHGAGGVAGPCVLAGNTSVIPLAHTAGCTPAGLRDPRRPTALVLRGAAPPPWARDWPRHPVPATYAPGWAVHVRP